MVVSSEDPDGTALLLEPHGDSFAKTYQDQVYQAGLPVIVFGADDVQAERKMLEAKGAKFRDDLAGPAPCLHNPCGVTFDNLIILQAIPEANEWREIEMKPLAAKTFFVLAKRFWT